MENDIEKDRPYEGCPLCRGQMLPTDVDPDFEEDLEGICLSCELKLRHARELHGEIARRIRPF
jgi:hypothetical protein